MRSGGSRDRRRPRRGGSRTRTEDVTGLADVARSVLAARSGGRAVAVVHRTEPGAQLARVLVFEDGEVRGSLGDAGLDDSARTAGAEALADPVAAARTIETDGVELYVEAHRPTARLFVVGAGHIAVPLVRVGALLGFPVTVLDDRDQFATEDRFPDAARVHTFDFEDPFAGDAPTAADYVVLATRAHRYDFDCLRALLALDPPPRYIGMVGSRRRVRAAFRALVDGGVTRERVEAVHAPIGVDIGADTPEEIAVSIAAELVAVRRGVTAAGSLRDRERVVERWLG